MPGKKKILVTGLSGVVGSAMRAELEEWYEVSSLSRYGVDGLPEERSFLADIGGQESILPAFEGQDAVIHLAADRSVMAGWESALSNNMIGTYNVFEAARKAGVERVVVGSSTAAVAGHMRGESYCHVLAGEYDKVTRPYPLIDEDVRPRPVGYYGVSKVYGEALGSFYSDFHGLSAIHIRIGMTISADDPTFSPAPLAFWLSHRDTAQVFSKAVDAPETLRYAVLNATSGNYWGVLSLERAKQLIGYEPQDDAGKTFAPGKMLERDRTDYKRHESRTVDETPDPILTEVLGRRFRMR